VFGLDRPGRVFISPSGDEGTLPTHAGGEYDASSPTVVAMTKFLNSTAFMSIWYTGSQPAQVTVTFNDGTSVGPVGPGGSINQNGVFIIQYAPGFEFYPWQSTSGDRAVWIRITGHIGPGTVQVRGTTPGVGRFDLHHGQLPNVLQFDDHLVPGRLTDYASTLSAIVAAAHVVRTSYFDINGIFRSVGQQGATGQLWQFSAGGPTRDGRIHGVDVSAPGHNCFAAYAPHSYWATIQSNLIQDGGGWYGRAQATSASAPIVLGTVALMLERGPNLTGRQVRDLLRQTAASDMATGRTPNANWGFGKIDVFVTVRAACPADIVPHPGGRGSVDIDDLLMIINNWGATGRNTADITRDGIVDMDDLLSVINAWGECPG
jgi:hypothetical protein